MVDTKTIEFQTTFKTSAKRLLDVCASCAGLVLFSPVFVLLSLIIRVVMGPPVFFRQQRAGLGGRTFEVMKFRTMSTAHDEQGRLLPDRERLTMLGRFLRDYSLDELPQLWNICIGEMSFVGPRPLLTKYLAFYSADQARRHQVKPGLTGWAQVSGRNALSWDERFELDLWYVDHWDLLLDAKIIFKTVRSVLRREGTLDGQGTMPEFTGNTKHPRGSVDCRPDSR